MLRNEKDRGRKKVRAEGSFWGEMAICVERFRSAVEEELFCSWEDIVDCNRVGMLRDVV